MKSTKLGIPENIEGVIAYLLAPITSIIMLILEKDNKFVKFHSLQSLFLSVFLGTFNYFVRFIFKTIFSFLPFMSFFGVIVEIIIAIITIIVYIVLIVMTFNGRMIIVPIIGDAAWNLTYK